MKICVLFGSYSRTGYCYAAIKKLFGVYDPKIIMLSTKKINYFSYANKYHADDFMKCINIMLEADLVCIACPVIWYCVTAQTKIFLDRMLDMQYFNKGIMPKIQSKKFVFVATYYGADPGYAEIIVARMLKHLHCHLGASLVIEQNQLTDELADQFQEACLDLF